MGKFHILTQILQGNALFTGKIYTAGKTFTRPLVVTVVTNFKSAHKRQNFICLCNDKAERLALSRLLEKTGDQTGDCLGQKSFADFPLRGGCTPPFR